MDSDQVIEEVNREAEAMKSVVAALKGMNVAGQTRVIDYVIRRLDLKIGAIPVPSQPVATTREPLQQAPASEEERANQPDEKVDDKNSVQDDIEDGLEGINPIAQKWMKRNGLSASQLSLLFSLGIEDIDLVAESVPGDSNKKRLRSVVLLKGIASYLSSGAARVDHKTLKEAALHYKADAGNNAATYMKEMAAEVGGSAASGYTLTSRGLTAATALVKELMKAASSDKS